MRLDLLHTVRSLRRSPTSAAAAVLILALTVGAGASIFAVVDAVLLTPPPFTDPDAIVMLGETLIDEPVAVPRPVLMATFDAWRERAASLATIEAIDGTNLTLTGLGPAERVSVGDVTPGFLGLLGAAPAFGRAFRADDAGQPVVIVNDAFWRRRLMADPNVIGQSIVLGGRSYTIVGVMPERFFFAPNPNDMWRPIQRTSLQPLSKNYRVGAVARLAPTASALQLALALDDVSSRSIPAVHATATPITTTINGRSRRTLGLLGAAAVLALMIAVANLTGLLMVRAIDRRRELAVRDALGARGSEAAKQLILEASVLVAVGTIAGILLAVWMTPLVSRLAIDQFGAIANRDIAVSWHVIALVTTVAVVCAGLCGTLPTLGAARWSMGDLLHRRSSASRRERMLRRAFVVGEIALAFVLLVSTAMVGRALLAVLDMKPGFDSRGVLTLQVSLPRASYPTAQRVASFYTSLQQALQERLGANAIAVVDELPLTGDRGRALVTGRPNSVPTEAVVRTASPGYVELMGIHLADGRSFDFQDNADAPLRVMVSESLANHLFGSERAIGRQLQLAGQSQPAGIVGIVGDVKHRALDERTLPTIYLSGLQAPSPSSIVIVRSPRSAADVIATVREEVARVDGDLPVYRVRPMEEVLAVSPGVPTRRVLTAAFMGFALLALVLSAIGLFGVAAHDVASRRSELAVRLALGADGRRLMQTTIGQGAVVVGAGLVLGGLLSMWATRALSGVIVSTHSTDVISVGTAAAVLAATGICAVLPAALRASRTDPLLALRGE